MPNSLGRNSHDTQNLRAFLYQRDKGTCQLCNQPVGFEEFTVDHKIPKSKGGSNNRKNLQLAHDECNQLKGNHFSVVLFPKWDKRPPGNENRSRGKGNRRSRDRVSL